MTQTSADLLIADTVPLPDPSKWKTRVPLENDLQFDSSFCGPSLYTSDENLHLRKTVATNEWRTCRAMNAGWSDSIHYWSVRINDRSAEGYLMIGVVTDAFDVSAVTYPGNTVDSFGFYIFNGHKYNGSNSVAFTSDLPKNGDVIGVLLDLEARTLTYLKNGKIVGTS
ncbi:unnamed protein product [Rotaria sp. Silwood1]|nr:unnamed protein product [Rotaria sp. Silwood1]CAF3678855.1 unnamed protein product [Rotaria sp. Silwood1]